MKKYYLWPCKDEERLATIINRGSIDIRETTPGFNDIQKGDKLFLCLHHGKYVYSATLGSSPFKQQNPIDPEFPMTVKITDIKRIEPPISTGMSPRCVTPIPVEFINSNWL
jgi:hypothetical protein